MCPTPFRSPIRVSEFFPYRGGELHAEEIAVSRIATAVGTPFYIYSAAAFAAQYRRFAEAFARERPLICYAVKANSNLAVLRVFAGLGAGADVVSEGELRRALAAGMPPQRILFSGVGKTPAELEAAIDAEIHQINIESVPELCRLSEIARVRGRVAPVAIRVNPDVDARTHAKISTGMKENKFGIDLGEVIAAYSLATELPGIEPVGLAVHIGSQLVDLEPYRRAFVRVAGLVRELRANGLAVTRIDLGGGLGIRYRAEDAPEPTSYARLVREIFGSAGLAMTFEPGRVLAGPAGLLVARVIYVKQGAAKRIVIVDAAMNDLIRPALYEAWHDIVPVRLPAADAFFAPADVVGPVCETTDTFAVDRDLPPVAEGDLVAFTAAGAYGAVMSSTYNSRPLVPEVLVAGTRFDVIRARPSYDDMLSLDTVPTWLSEVSPAPARKRGAA
ncbi:MAG: diaminopimelate decarboxylase [Alphaproteobacteria bacterium]|nr:diaminopimelate decarboxylase [Alphaproteobacteria bacterium]